MHVTFQNQQHGAIPYSPHSDVPHFSTWQRFIWCLMFATSGLVFFEPAPFDLMSLALFVLFLLLGLKIPKMLHFFIICCGLFITFSLLSSINAFKITDATKHILVTAFLVIMSIFTACVLASGNKKMSELLWRGWLIAALIATMAGIAGFLELVPEAETFTKYGRAKGTFKDPNVFGPFLVPPAIYAFMKFIQGKGLPKAFYLGLLGVLAIGILLSFSRAAWGHLVVSMIIAMAAIAITAVRNSERFSLLLFVVFAGIISVVGISILFSVESFSSLFAERFSLSQSYDSGGQGRFNGQLKAIEYILEHPFGIGANEFLRYWHEAPHNVYLTNFLSGGWIAGLAFIALTLATLFIGLKGAFTRTPYRLHMIIAASSFSCLALVGLVVDLDHWRHFYVLLGAVWGLHIAAIQHSEHTK